MGPRPSPTGATRPPPTASYWTPASCSFSIARRSAEMETATQRAVGWVFLGSTSTQSSGKVGVDPTADGALSHAHAPPIPPSSIGLNSSRFAHSLLGHDEPIGMIRDGGEMDLYSMRSKYASPTVGALLARRSKPVLEPCMLADLAEQTRHFDDITDSTVLLERLPSVLQLIDSLPESLPLIEAVYVKCHQLKRFGSSAFPVRALRPEALLTQVLWWLAHAEDDTIVVSNRQISRLSSPSSLPYNLFDTTSRHPDVTAFKFAIMLPHLQSLLRIIHSECGELLEELRAEREHLNESLEAFGLHGMVNCSGDRLIRLADAARIELSAHHSRLKSLVAQIDKGNGALKGKGWSINSSAGRPVPTRASHQRQMTMRASEVCDRMEQNEAIQEILTAAVENNELESLLRIVRKRVHSDKHLLSRFQALKSSAPPGYAVIEADPVVAKVLVRFKAAYDKLLALAPTAVPPTRIRTDDSGVGLDDSDRGLSCSSPDTMDGDDSPAPAVKRSARLSGPVAQQLKARNLLLPRPVHHHSLSELPIVDRSALLKPVRKSLSNSNLAINATFEMYRHQNGRAPRSGSSSTDSDAETARLRNHVNRLGAELTAARFQIRQLTSVNDYEHFSNERLCWPEPDYPEASSYYFEETVRSPKSENELTCVIRRFGDLFAKDRIDIMNQLNCLPEFTGLEELQLKTIFSVIVLTFRSVHDSVERRRAAVWEALESSAAGGPPVPGQSADADSLDVAIYRHMHRRAKGEHGMANAKEVTSQIWKTLYDFPSLKTCTRFNRFILECVAVVWDLVAGVEGKPPRLRLEYESMQFDSDKHLRFHSSSLRSSAIKRYVWPGLIENGSEKLVHKGIVVT